MKTRSIILLFFCALLFITCSSDDVTTDTEPEINLDQYLGTYHINMTHITGIHEFYDDIGNVIGQGIDTLDYQDLTLVITTLTENNDTLLLSGLVATYPLFQTDVQAVISMDTIRIVHENSSFNSSNYIRGNLWLEGDSIHFDYHWDSSDTWSADAFPFYGKVVGSGSK